MLQTYCNTVSPPELLAPKQPKRKNMPHYTKKSFLDTNSTRVELVPAANNLASEYEYMIRTTHMQYKFILFCNLSAKRVYFALKIDTTPHNIMQ